MAESPAGTLLGGGGAGGEACFTEGCFGGDGTGGGDMGLAEVCFGGDNWFGVVSFVDVIIWSDGLMKIGLSG